MERVQGQLYDHNSEVRLTKKEKSKEFLRNGYLVLRIGSLCYNIEQLSPQNNKYFDYLLKSLVALK